MKNYSINKITADTTVDFAAEELKKYLRMLMPRCGEIPVAYAPNALSGFRIGLMSDFGLDTSDAENISLDDIVYIDTDANGGIIAGSNVGAVLIAVYRYLKFLGCRWIFPGVDGEYVPYIDGLKDVMYRKLADCRYRGQCNEGAESQQCMLETIDFTPKIGMNTYMIEFDIPRCYYDDYYDHKGTIGREAESITNEQVLQWKRQCETEIAKRGLKFHDMGHGWTAEPFGFDSKLRAEPTEFDENMRIHLAMKDDGVRRFHGSPINTNVCMSNPETRRIMAEYIADYAETQNNVDFLHIWLADGQRNHCVCENCLKKSVPDHYIVLLNDIDNELTRRGLKTHLVFIVYTETFWAPTYEKLNNKERFTMLYAPFFRRYDETYAEPHDYSQLYEYKRNNNENPRGMGACLAYLDEWKKHWDGDCFCYEYHFYVQQYRDPTGMFTSKILFDDIANLRQNGLSGIVEDGSQRSFFPTGFMYYVYGEKLFDNGADFEDLKRDYFENAFGENYRLVTKYLEDISAIWRYGVSTQTKDELERIMAVVSGFGEVINANKNRPFRAQSVAWRLLGHFEAYMLGLCKALIKRAEGDTEGAKEAYRAFLSDMTMREPYIERHYDLWMNYHAIHGLFGC